MPVIVIAQYDISTLNYRCDNSQTRQGSTLVAAEIARQACGAMLESLDDPKQREIDALWAEKRRTASTPSTKAKLRSIPGSEVFKRTKREEAYLHSFPRRRLSWKKPWSTTTKAVRCLGDILRWKSENDPAKLGSSCKRGQNFPKRTRRCRTNRFPMASSIRFVGFILIVAIMPLIEGRLIGRPTLVQIPA